MARQLAGPQESGAATRLQQEPSNRPISLPPHRNGDSAPAPTFVLTGERLLDRFRVIVEGAEVKLTRMSFRTLLSLIVARLETATGFVALDRIAVSLLRRHCDEGMSPGAGKKLIETGFRQEYRLSIPPDLLAVTLEPSFAEVEGLGIISRKQSAHLQSLLRKPA